MLSFSLIVTSSYPSNQEVEKIAQDYYKSHTYIDKIYDCSEMTQDFWNICISKGWETKIVWKRLNETQSHAFIYVKTNDSWLAVDPTGGNIVKNNDNIELSGIKVNGTWYYENVTTFNDTLEFRKFLYK